MNNPFEAIENRLSSIEHRLIKLATTPTFVESSPEVEKPVDIDTAAEFLNLKKPTIYSKCSKGELPHMKRDKRLYFFLSELSEYLRKGCKQLKIKTRGEAIKDLPKKSPKQNKLRDYLLEILFKKAIHVFLDKIEIDDLIFLKTLFHQGAELFMNVFDFL